GVACLQGGGAAGGGLLTANAPSPPLLGSAIQAVIGVVKALRTAPTASAMPAATRRVQKPPTAGATCSSGVGSSYRSSSSSSSSDSSASSTSPAKPSSRSRLPLRRS